MNGKLAVVFNKFPRTEFSYQKLRCCTRCGTYTSVPESDCPVCGRRDRSMYADKLAHTLTKLRFQIIGLSYAAFFCAALILSGNPVQLAVTVLLSAVSAVLLKIMFSVYYRSEAAVNLTGMFRKRHMEIKRGLDTDLRACETDYNSRKYKEAYEKLRYIAAFLTDDGIKTARIACLDKFILRKDMDLEVDSLLSGGFNMELVYYIHEVSKVNRGLIKSKAVDYIIKYERDIIENSNADYDIHKNENPYEILGNIAGAVLKTRQHLAMYRDFVSRYLKFMKRERILRLCKLLKLYYVNDWEELRRETMEIVRNNYYNDPEFKEYIV